MKDVILYDFKIFVIKNDIIIGKVDNLCISYDYITDFNTSYLFNCKCKNFMVDLKFINKYDKDCLLDCQGYGFKFDLYIVKNNIEISKDFNVVKRNDSNIVKKEFSVSFAELIQQYILKDNLFILENTKIFKEFNRG